MKFTTRKTLSRMIIRKEFQAGGLSEDYEDKYTINAQFELVAEFIGREDKK